MKVQIMKNYPNKKNKKQSFLLMMAKINKKYFILYAVNLLVEKEKEGR